MLFEKATFIGIDPTAGVKPFVYAALDAERRLLALGQGGLDDVLAFAAGQRQAVVGVCAPQRPNQGVMGRDGVRQGLAQPPRPGHWVDFRLADYLLRQRGIPIPQTPAQEETCPNWMRMGFNLHRRLEALGYRPYPQEGADLQCLEIYPHAGFAALLGVLPFAKHSLEGRLQRQLALYDLKMDVPDPMDFFEEITRYKLLHGVLPMADLHTPSELDALLAAYTAWLAAGHPEMVTLVGDVEEGQIVLPVGELKASYR